MITQRQPLWPPLPLGEPPTHAKLKIISNSDLNAQADSCEMLFSTDTSPDLIKALSNFKSDDTDNLQKIGKFVKAVAIAHAFSLPRRMRITYSTGDHREDGTLSSDVYICTVSKASNENVLCLLHMRIECNSSCTKVGLVSRMEEDGLVACMKLWTKSYFEQLY